MPDRPSRSWAERIPNAYVLVFGLLVLAAAASWLVPVGQFARAEVGGRVVVVPGTFEWLQPGEPLPAGNAERPSPQGLGATLTAPVRGFAAAAEIIAFILILGGVFQVVEATGTVRSGIARTVRAFHGREILIIPVVMVLFSLAGAVIGTAEETIPFVLLFVPLALAMGYDSITAVGMVFVAALSGFAAAFVNPFTLGIAQGIAELPPTSGMGYRLVVWVIVTGVAIAYVMRHALRVRRDPSLSPVADIDRARREEEGLDVSGADRAWSALEAPMTGRQKIVLALFGLALVLLAVGVVRWGWYIQEIAALFLGFGILAAVVARLGGDGFVRAFTDGAAALLGAALVVGLARAVVIVAQDGGIIDPLLYVLSGGIGALHPVVSAQVMFLVQSVLNFLVPSGSGQAALTMPLMAPLADLVGVTRQTAVLAYQFGDGFTNMIIPTNPVLLAVLGAARIPWAVWARWIIPFQLLLVVLGLVLLVPPVLMGWGPH
jgi:uncharacterized ion transporter superfamily protein YfcC